MLSQISLSCAYVRALPFPLEIDAIVEVIGVIIVAIVEETDGGVKPLVGARSFSDSPCGIL